MEPFSTWRPAFMNLDTSNSALADRYDAIPYAAVPHPVTTPDSLATLATFLGLDPPPVAHARVLEVGSNDGSNLIPMAAALPNARFVGCDLSALATAAGRRTIDALRLANIELVEEDLSALSPAHGNFDYIVAHGIYSWVPPSVRDALFALAQDRLAPNGVMFVSYNALPGARIRQTVWEVLHLATDGIADTRQRLDAARRIARIVANGPRSTSAGDDALREAFRAVAETSDSELFHDDLGVPNEPVWLHAFVAHAARYGLRYLADVDLRTMNAAGVDAEGRALLGTLDAVTREQYLDFVRLRRFRQSLLCRADASIRALDPQRLRAMHASADPSLVRASEAGKVADLARGLDPAGAGGGPVRALLDALLAAWPASIAVGELPVAGALPAPLESILIRAFVASIVALHVHPPTVVAVAGARPRASALARHEAATQAQVTNQLHARVQLPDASARRLLAMLDGETDRAAAARAFIDPARGVDATQATQFVDSTLAQFARLALLVG